MASGSRWRFITVSTAWLGTCVSCVLAIVYFYGLLRGADIYPLGGDREQGIAAARTAVFATVVSFWAIWIATKPGVRLTTALWRVELGIQISLTLFAIAGWQSASRLDLIFPSTFFAEYNWLTFILEVAPATSVAAALLVGMCWGLSSHREIA